MLVTGMAGMTANPLPAHLMAVDLLVELLPKVGILHRLLARRFPPALLPVGHPVVDALHDVLRVGHQTNLARALQLRQPAYWNLGGEGSAGGAIDRTSTRLNSSN